MRLRFNRIYFLAAVLLFIIEVLIAAYLHDRILRPYIGDMLVVVLIYCSVKAFTNTPVRRTALAVLAFAFFIEALQYFRIVHRLGLADSKLARIVIGTTFEWMDFLVYICGIGIVLLAETIASGRKSAAHRANVRGL